MSQTMSAGNPSNIVDPPGSGHVLEREVTNADETHGSDESDDDNSDVPMALDKQIACATRV